MLDFRLIRIKIKVIRRLHIRYVYEYKTGGCAVSLPSAELPNKVPQYYLEKERKTRCVYINAASSHSV